MTDASSISRFKLLTFALALALGCQAIWIVVPEAIRPASFRFPSDAATSRALAGFSGAATSAARAAAIRGDLWAAATLAQLYLFWSPEKSGAQNDSSTSIHNASVAAASGVRLSPHNSKLWAALASFDLRLGLNGQANDALKMSYLTGSNDADLALFRTALALRSDGLSGNEMQQFLRRDLRLVVMNMPASKPAVVDAYRAAPEEGKKVLGDILRELAPDIAAAVRSDARSR